MSRFSVGSGTIPSSQTVVDGNMRVSVITDRILRVEYSPNAKFDDRPSQQAFYRDFDTPTFSVEQTADEIFITTSKKEFLVSKHTGAVMAKRDGKWVSSKAGKNLKGTVRTLDFARGMYVFGIKRIKLCNGLFSTCGVTEIDDSASCLINPDGSISPRDYGYHDKYVFAFDDDYLGGLKEFYGLTGYTPLLPKYVLGNWWSRYHRYTQQEYLSLMDRFADEGIPFTVATVDMDWHLVDGLPKEVKSKSFPQGKGWTGYTFNRELFPDHKRFFDDLKSRGLAITLNLHPRDGVRFHEEQYPKMARANGIDPSTKKAVEFDCTSLEFMQSYFDVLHHPYEDEGVDFWWIDWQQGKRSKVRGLDPLWALNHYHTLDASRKGQGVILSRYAGIGSHRYPVGFSGDTWVRWASLKIQPYFTAIASNVGYTWWSHDIGGHIFGKGDSELYVRWLQFGVFSPINRLHSNNKSWSKEPWLYGEKAEKISGDFLRLRHRLLPYLYTANVRTAREGVPLVMPMYYLDKSKEAYSAKNQYWFGSELVVAPVVTKGDENGLATTSVYLPNGEWTDFFTGEKYVGGQISQVQTPLDRMPVFAKKGAIIPLLVERRGNSQIFDELEVLVYPGENEYTMYDEGGYTSFAMVKTDDGFSLTIDQTNNRQKAKIKVTVVGDDTVSVCEI